MKSHVSARQKRGVSEIVGYVLLVSITLIIAGIVFVGLKASVSSSEEMMLVDGKMMSATEMVCEDNIALAIRDYSYNCSTQVLNLTLQNRGLFDVGGFTTKFSNASGAKIGSYLLNKTGRKLLANEISNEIFDVSGKGILTFVDMQAYKIQDGKVIYCKDAVVKQEIECATEPSCTASYTPALESFCGIKTVTNSCVGSEEKEGTLVCSNGCDQISHLCLQGSGCDPTTSCVLQGKTCGTIYNGCNMVSCGTCSSDEFCNSSSVCVPKWIYQENASSSSFADFYIYLNYSKPIGVLSSSLWKIRQGFNAAYNISLPDSCWNYNSQKLILRMYSKGTVNQELPVIWSATSWSQCFNGTWVRVGVAPANTLHASPVGGDGTEYYPPALVTDGNWETYNVYSENQAVWMYPYSASLESPRLYEEAMWWNFA